MPKYAFVAPCYKNPVNLKCVVCSNIHLSCGSSSPWKLQALSMRVRARGQACRDCLGPSVNIPTSSFQLQDRVANAAVHSADTSRKCFAFASLIRSPCSFQPKGCEQPRRSLMHPKTKVNDDIPKWIDEIAASDARFGIETSPIRVYIACLGC